jgi:dipeptide transport system ATP-binding protein
MSEADTLLARGCELKKYYDVKPAAFQKSVDLKALDGVSFELRAGKTLAVVGESGCGKSTLARLLTLIEAPTAGQLEIVGQVVHPKDKRQIQQLRKSVQMIFQDPYGSLNPRKNVGAILAESLKINTRLKARERDELVIEMLEKVGLRAEHVKRYPHMFSGGQRQRIAIARALILKPALVVADEPVSALDISIQAQVLNLLMDLQDELNTAYVFISHGLSVVEHIADEVMVMYLGRPVEQGAKGVIFDSPLHPYTRALLASTPFVDPQKRVERVALTGELPSPLNPPGGCAFHQRCPQAMPICREQRPELKPYHDRLIACFLVE